MKIGRDELRLCTTSRTTSRGPTEIWHRMKRLNFAMQLIHHQFVAGLPVALVALFLGACNGGTSDPTVQAMEPPPALQLGAALPDQQGFDWQLSAASIAESERLLSLTLEHSGDADSGLAIGYATREDSALAGADFQAAAGQLLWEAGEAGTRTLTVTVLSDALEEGAEQFHIDVWVLEGGEISPGTEHTITVTIADAACEALVPEQIETTFTLSEPCYQLPGVTRVTAGGALLIGSGVTVVASPAAQLHIDGGSIESVGTAELPVHLTASAALPGSWQGVLISDSLAGNTIEHTHITYAHTGLRLDEFSFVGSFNNNVLKDNASSPVYLHANSFAMLDGTTRYSGNGIDQITVGFGTITDTTRWNRLDVPAYLTSGVAIDDYLEIAPGSTLRFAADTRLFVSQSGVLRAQGTIDERIRFEGTAATAGHWYGFQFVSSGLDTSIIEFADIAHAGGEVVREAAITLAGAGPRVRLANLDVIDSAGHGVLVMAVEAELDVELTNFVAVDGSDIHYQ